MVKSIFKLTNPILLLLISLAYTLGAGIVHYLGHGIQPASFWLGLLSVLSLLCAGLILAEYFRLPFRPLEQGETYRLRERFRITLLQISYAALSLGGVVILTLILTNLLTASAGILLVLAFIMLMAYAVPPMRLSEKGYGELVLAIFLGSLTPALGFLLQENHFHRLLTYATFPLTLLALTYLLICNFPTFATDQKLGRQTMLTRLTWQRAIPIHHFLVLTAFLLYAVSPFLGIPWRLVGPVFLVLPFAAMQILWLQRIANGRRTLWNFLTAIASATCGLSAYLLALTFWIR
jgi:1,4-dihydroxy-2-naphthoate octaprenyltransferase